MAKFVGIGNPIGEEMVDYKFDRKSELIKVGLKLPNLKDEGDWDWYRFSADPDEKVKELLRKGNISLGKPKLERKGEAEYFLKFAVMKVRRKETGDWILIIAVLSLILALIALFLFISSI